MDAMDSAAELAKVNGGVISKQKAPLSIGQLEHRLLERFPASDAESWDRMGLISGDPTRLVTGVMVALDPTLEAVFAARDAGADVLLTHHPVFLDPPAAFSPPDGPALLAGAVLWEAIAGGVALMNIHTALDASEEASKLLPSLLSLDAHQVLLPLEGDPRKGYGRVCSVRAADRPLGLEQLAARCVSVFSSTPRVWGPASRDIDTVAVVNGAAGRAPEVCLAEGIPCLICGEVRYHSALEAAQRGLAIIEVGHDVSELPLCALLAQAAVEAGVPADAVSIFDQTGNWTVPDAQRL